MDLRDLFEIKERIIKEAIEHSKTLPESERRAYVNTSMDAAAYFYAYAMIKYIDSEVDEKKKSA
jgi:hypothetical protein